MFPGPGVTRLILAAMVVESHYREYAAWNPCDAIAVYGFFFLSGYWIATLWTAKYSRTHRPVLTFYLSRLWRILPLAMIGNVAAILIIPATADTIVRSLLLLGSATLRTYPVDPPLWSIDVELQFYLLAPLLLATMHYRIITALVLTIGFFGLFSLATQILPTTVLSGLVLFALGILFAWHRQFKAARRLAPYCVTAIVLAVTLADLTTPSWLPNERLLNVATAFFFLPVVAATLERKSGALDRSLGDLAYPLYVIHFPIRYFGETVIPQHSTIVPLALTIAMTLILYAIVDRPSEMLRQRFVNRRLQPT
jgi:peptidoglycan/LPS O-acetylase OafA/YrhL